MKNIANKKIILGILIVGAVVLEFFAYNFLLRGEYNLQSIINDIEDDIVEVSEYAIFGTHLRIVGSFSLDKSYEKLELILKSNTDEIVIEDNIKSDSLYYLLNTGGYKNSGLYLENINVGEYVILLKTVNMNGSLEDITYYSLVNNTTYSNMDYYTFSKNGKHIVFSWEDNNGISYLKVKVSGSKLPSDYYDITIDPGHGGKDVGAYGYIGEDLYYESNINLETSLVLKKELESRGYKVRITRSDDSWIDQYGSGSRTEIANETKSKYNLAIHANSTAYRNSEYRGFEIFVSGESDISFARIIRNKFLEYGIDYSNNTSYKVEDGIYMRLFTQRELEEDTFQPTRKTLKTNYYYFIREVGGISTYADNYGQYLEEKGFPANNYYNSNNTAEPYILELGYVTNSDDLYKLINNREEYAKAIADAIDEYIR